MAESLTWADELKKIRRLLRDPDGNIWDETFLRNSYNDEQRYLQNKFRLLYSIEAVRVPNLYEMSYLYPWEYEYTDSDGKRYQALRYHHQSPSVCCNLWEIQIEGGIDSSANGPGFLFTHPFEAWYSPDSSVPGIPVPVWFPPDMHSIDFIAWDEEPIEMTTLKRVQSEDPSWFSRSGEPQWYFRKDEESNEGYLYPRPSDPSWDDVQSETAGEYEHGGPVLHDDGADPDSEFGFIIDREDTVFNQVFGITTDVIEQEDNLLIIYRKYTTDIDNMDSEGSFPQYLRKYVQYGVLARANSANTDGKIDSLKKYWQMRWESGQSVIKRFRHKRFVDRDYRLVTKQTPFSRNRRGPRLPDEYPAVW